MKYKLIRILSRKNKEGKIYYLACLVLFTDTDCELLRVLITEEQKEKLMKVLNDVNFDISKYVSIEYNSYQKQYQPKICY